ncbi:unnamed protein product [marine sediment metagenome]|uniref:Uncharacterized protein n=1 Tax=marine sediment metagenome TaxID=412755 RepID=X1URH5_9ZZZZ
MARHDIDSAPLASLDKLIPGWQGCLVKEKEPGCYDQALGQC